MSYVHPCARKRCDLSRPRFEKQGPRRRVRVRDVPGLVFRLELDSHYRALPIADDGSPDRPKNFTYALYGVDAGIADVLRILNCHGYPTMTSMSGLLADYPDSDEGAAFGYILFFKMDPRLEKRIMVAARSCGMGAKPPKKGGWARGVHIDTTVLASGKHESDLYFIAENEARRALGPRAGFRRKSGFREFVQRRVVELHQENGGYTDDKGVKKLWSCFTERLTGTAAVVF